MPLESGTTATTSDYNATTRKCPTHTLGVVFYTYGVIIFFLVLTRL